MHRYRRLLQYLQRQRSRFILIAVLTVTASSLVALQPWPMKLLVDHVLASNPLPPWLNSATGPAITTQSLLLIVVLGGLCLFILNSLFDAALTWSWTVAGRRVVYDLAEDMFARLQRRSLLFHSRNAVGDTMSRITVDSWAVHKVIDALLFSPAHALLTIAAMVFLMSRLDPMLTWVALITAPLMVGASMMLGKPLRAAAKLKREIESRMQSHLQQTLTGIPVVQAFAQEEREQARFEKFADSAIRVQQRSTLIGSVNSLTSGLVTTLGTGVILWFGAQHVLAGAITIGSLLVFLVYLGSLQTQMKIFTALYTTAQGLSASIDRVVEVLDAPSEIVEKPNASALPRVRGEVQFDGVSFEYEPERPVLREISFTVPSGQTVALVGHTGAGKSTLVNLIPRFHDPTTGRVLIDGHDVRALQLNSLRSNIALVLQEPFLFPFSVAENIAYGRPEASRDEIEAAARAANAHEFIMRMPQGYDTVMGERGATLSGGERQRLAIARALLKNAPILILDEPTSALDAATERSIIEALERLMAGRTTFIIAHRLSTVRRAKQIVVLDQGRLVEKGTHDELMARAGSYARFQTAAFSPATTTP
jgi:ATP-binding cassette subfamily B protein/subfamily B ATP-binding cassette protein MsbA